jgi:hypothetical protein
LGAAQPKLSDGDEQNQAIPWKPGCRGQLCERITS